MFVVLALKRWEDIEVSFPVPSRGIVAEDEPCIGFLPVYPTRKIAEEVWPGKEIREVRVVEEAADAAE